MGEIVESWLASQIASTRKVYALAIRDFLRSSSAEELLADPYACRELVLRYRAEMIERGREWHTVDTRIGAVRSLVAHARQVGRIDWRLQLEPGPSCWGPGGGFEGLVGGEGCG
jgi:hypothetical protein